ncbi:MAG: ParB N-terminal domain-containing protein, partial [Acidobacteria bacterium]|nr:ParB N-terminal domain-containing protein [Acidobacteriota bacterium]
MDMLAALSSSLKGQMMPTEFHELSNIFPMMSEVEFDSLVADIKEHGLREAIWTHDGKIIDGRNRFKACQKLGVKPAFRKWDGKGSLISFVVSHNLHRRNLSTSQLAMVAANIANIESSKHASSIELAVSQPQAAKMLNVSLPSVKRATT